MASSTRWICLTLQKCRVSLSTLWTIVAWARTCYYQAHTSSDHNGLFSHCGGKHLRRRTRQCWIVMNTDEQISSWSTIWFTWLQFSWLSEGYLWHGWPFQWFKKNYQELPTMSFQRTQTQQHCIEGVVVVFSTIGYVYSTMIIWFFILGKLSLQHTLW